MIVQVNSVHGERMSNIIEGPMIKPNRLTVSHQAKIEFHIHNFCQFQSYSRNSSRNRDETNRVVIELMMVL